MNNFAQQGQALLVVVLVLVLTLTVGLSVASRSITNVNITKNEDESQRAFSAAEAGIERAVKECPNGTVCNQPFIPLGDAQYSFSTSLTSGTTLFLSNGTLVEENDGVDIWLVNRDATGKPLAGKGFQNNGGSNINVYWGTNSDQCGKALYGSTGGNTMAAMEIIAITGDLSANQYYSYHYVADPCSDRANSTNDNFGSPPNPPNLTVTNGPFTGTYSSFQYKITIPLINIVGPPANRGILLRVVPLYAPTKIGLECTSLCRPAPGISDPSDLGGFPNQGNVVTSTGTALGTARKINYYKQITCPPEFCQYSLFMP